MKVVSFVRVSTNIQDYERQINELNDLAKQKQWEITTSFAEKVSGAKKNIERKELSRMVSYVESNKIDKIIVTELSRLGRDTLQVLEVIEMLNAKGISLYIQNYGIETLMEDGQVNPVSQFLITILAEVARMERKTIKERMDSGYKNFIANGGKVGRKIGYRKSTGKMKEQYKDEIRLLHKKYSLRNISRLTGTSVNTLRKIKSLLEKEC